MMSVKRKKHVAFTLIETIVVLMLAALVLVAVLGIYSRVRAGAVTIMDRLQENRFQTEVLQKIAEDIDRLAAPGFDAKINFQNKIDNGYRSARLILENNYYGAEDNKGPEKKTTFEKIEWVTTYDPSCDALKLYRLHGGLNAEDKLLEKAPDATDREQFIPVAEGVTFFEIKARQGEAILGDWASDALPKAVRVGFSLAPLQELPDGSMGVPEDQIFFRTIAIDRTRLIPYQFIKKKFDLPEEDPNDISQDPNDIFEDPNEIFDQTDE
jgi:type II secretory pathway pseudopilin PulG